MIDQIEVMKRALELAREGVEIHSPNSPEYKVCAALIVIAEAPKQKPVEWLTDDEREAFERFNETCEDGEGYDVPKPMMKRLAEIGVIHHTSRGIYGITKFGHSVLGYTSPSQRQPLTDDEFISMVDSTGLVIDPELAFEIKEMVESAHGIGEKK